MHYFQLFYILIIFGDILTIDKKNLQNFFVIIKSSTACFAFILSIYDYFKYSL